MTKTARIRKMQQLQKQIEAMHPLAIELVSEKFTNADRRKFLEGVSFWMMFELSDAFNRLCAEDRRELKGTAATAKRKRSPAP
jgi:division protein CdvB (Snf7/Vps24/ESCRT-III family)